MNWLHISSHKTGEEWVHPITKKSVHSRSHSKTGVNKQFGVLKKVYKTSELIRIKKGEKHKYIYPLTKELKDRYLTA